MTSESFDVVIVGGGAAGCALGRRLSESGERSVLLLEAGPDLARNVPAPMRDGWNNPTGSDWANDWGFVSEPGRSGATDVLRRGRLLGGTSWLTRFAVRGPASDYDAWAARGNAGWRYDDVLPSFRGLETDIEFGERPWHGASGPLNITRYPLLPRSDIHLAALEAFAALGFRSVDDHNAPDAVGFGPMPMSTRNGQRVTALDAYLPFAGRPPKLEIRANSEVARVVIDSRRATAVELVDGTVIGGGWIVISAGTYGSPPLLMRSGIGPARHLREVGVEVRVDLRGVGENLADHPGVDLDSGWAGEGAAPGEPVLHTIATFRSSASPVDAPPDMMFWVQDPAGPSAAFYFDPILLKPESRGSVRLRSADPRAHPIIRLPGLAAERDVERLAEGYLRGLDLANNGAVRRLTTNSPPSAPASTKEFRDRVYEAAYSNPHVVGTCRMGPSPEGGDVVDAMGSVHGVEHLSVIDASIISEPPTGFPHAITIMLAEHLAARLRSLM